jgi:hypothetical protein
MIDAQNAIDRAAMLAEKSDDRQLRMGVAITKARVRAAAGKPAEAMKSLANVLAEATKADRYRRERRTPSGSGYRELSRNWKGRRRSQKPRFRSHL